MDSEKKYRISLFFSVLSLVVSGVAAYFTYSGNKLQETNFIKAVQPRISIVPQADINHNGIGFYFYNDGPGVGYIENLIITDMRGKSFDLSDTSEKKPAIALEDITGFSHDCLRSGFPKKGSSVSVGTMEPLITLSSPITKPECIKHINDMVEYTTGNQYNFEAVLIYNSSYGKRYEYSFPSNITKELD
ncbi:hypothetical protein [Morganella morganii]|uniref:hypothetical protein n=1 Tax=Morganella morganii TaxID=582 RepID=UPI0024BB0FCB|nr:hypothetical protein [Morganella morganii]BEP21615.1 hypothetical protein SUGSMm_24120 [Morganella morganii subsp. sibonii]HDS6844706.1 hypothetical protein [Morganella morganii subsp. morganii]EKK5569338.1 hypothetical protein [Morganella morganii]ELB1545903.1 hypothetical protein [Morganella morganii]HDU8309312.1 hypothetical protein [Morganella morganii subsp. sibonii]